MAPQTQTARAIQIAGILLSSWALPACACWSPFRAGVRHSSNLEVVNQTGVTVCGLYIWSPEEAGNTGVVATSPEMNNWLQRGTYMVAEAHEMALHPQGTRQFKIRVSASDRVTIVARNCDDNIIYERRDVCLAGGSKLELDPG